MAQQQQQQQQQQEDLTGPPTKAKYVRLSISSHLCRHRLWQRSSATDRPPNPIQQSQHYPQYGHNRASSVLNRNVREFGVARLFDGGHDTCWNSEQVKKKRTQTFYVVELCDGYVHVHACTHAPQIDVSIHTIIDVCGR